MGPQRDQMLSAVTELQTSVGTESFPDNFQKLLSFSVNAMTVLGPFLPALGQLAASAFMQVISFENFGQLSGENLNR